MNSSNAGNQTLIEIGAVHLEVSEVPGAPPVVAAAHPADVFGAPTAQLLAGLTGGHQVLVANPRGLGASSEAPPDYDLAAMVEDLEAVRRARRIDRWLFWGMSGGGWLAQLYAHLHPGSLSGVILESVCACFRRRLADPSCLISPFHPSWRARLEAEGLLAGGSHDQVGDPQATEWVELSDLGKVFRRRGGPALLVSPFPIGPEMMSAMPLLWALDCRPWLSSYRLPTLVIAGAADPVVPAAHVRELHRSIPGAKLVEIAGAGHVPSSTRSPELQAAVRAFLSGVG